MLNTMRKIIIAFAVILFSFHGKAQVNEYEVEAYSYMILQGDTIRLDTSTIIDGQVIKRVAGIWTNGAGGEGSASVDSLIWYPLTGDIGWYISGSVSNTMNIDGRYILLSDSSKFVAVADSGITYYSKNQIDNLLATTTQIVYTITLPIAGTLAGSIVAATEGIDYPTGWLLTASGNNLLIQHNLNRYCAAATVSYNSTGSVYRQLVSYQTAFNTIQNDSNNSMQIVSISSYYTQYKLRVNLIFE